MSRDSKDKVNGLILEIDGITGYFPKPFIVEAIKTYMGKSDRKALINEIVELSEENETLKDNNEHLAVMLMEAKAEVAREIIDNIASITANKLDEERYDTSYRIGYNQAMNTVLIGLVKLKHDLLRNKYTEDQSDG